MLLSWLFVILLRFTAGFLFWVFTLGVIGIIAYVIILCILEVFVLLMLIFLRNRIRISIALLKEGSNLYHQYITTFQIFNLFVFLWLINFVIALGQCALAGAFASYYWALKKPDDIPPYPLFNAFGRAIRYHTGSLAFGSLILATVQMFRLILEYLDKRLKRKIPEFIFTQTS
ncbi:hypothetical protein CB1_000356002 [Camelus ferus]|nr:hypothetical protein CB1_000356002 [Camelus ferus]